MNSLKNSITDTRDSEIFVQTIYESSNFNANTNTDYILSNFYAKSAYQNADYQVAHSKLRKEKMNAHQEFGRKYAKIYTRTKLKFK